MQLDVGDEFDIRELFDVETGAKDTKIQKELRIRIVELEH